MKIILFFFLTLSAFIMSGVFDDGGVSVMEGYSVTLHTGVVITVQEDIKWYFNDIRISQINGDLSFICTDVKCNEGNERFRDRLKVDHQTGSLTITNTRTTDSGVYELKIITSSSIREKNFNVTVQDVPADDLDEVKAISVKEGETVTLDSGVIKNPNDVMQWYFNEALITEDLSTVCSNVHCEERDNRFRDRLKVDHQTGSLTITNTRTTDSGEYKLQINSHVRIRSLNSLKVFSVTVTGLSSAFVGGVSAGVAGVAVVASIALVFLITYCSCKRQSRRRGTRMNYMFQRIRFKDSTPKLSENTSTGITNDTSQNENEPEVEIM